LRIVRVRLQNIRTFGDIEIGDIPDTAIIVSPNGLGKSTILEAIVGTHELVGPYIQTNYPHNIQYGNKNIQSWPAHLRPLVTVGKKKGLIELDVVASDTEVELLRNAKISEVRGTVKIVLESPRYVLDVSFNEAVRKLFEFHTPTEGYGYVDYTRPVRFYPNIGVGNLTDTGTEPRVRNVFSEFHRGQTDSSKFQDFKTFVVTSTLNDATRRQETGVNVDSLEVFKDVFNNFFAPKRFIGPKLLSPGAPMEMLVQTQFGSHDTDLLSDGEKEILHVLAHLYQYRHLPNVVLWDTPESNLNSRLEARLYEALRRVAPLNQYFIASHGLELIESVPPTSIFVLKNSGLGVTLERLGDKARRTKVALYRELGARVGLQAVSSAVIFLEGKNQSADKRHLDRLLREELPSVNIVAGGDSESVLGVGTRANALLQDACSNGDFLAVTDRDYRTDDDIVGIEKLYKGRVFVWRVHEFENLFLDPGILLTALQDLDLAEHLTTIAEVEVALRESTKKLTSWIAADWTRWDVHHKLVRPSGWIGMENPEKDLLEYAARVRGTATNVTDDGITDMFATRSRDVDRLLSTTLWRERLPGKQILRRFLADHAKGIETDLFVAAAVSGVVRGSFNIPEIKRLKVIVEAMIGGAGI
jgi:predicted ATPase